MATRIEQHKQRLAEARALLNRALEQIGDQGETPIYSDGAQWTLRQLVIHLALADKGHNRMLLHYAEGKEFIPADYDMERYNKRSVEKQDSTTLAQAREMLAATRAELLAWLDQQDDAILDKTGRHASLKIMTLSEIMDVMAAHEEEHANDILTMLDRQSP